MTFHPIAPVYDAHSRILILGSFPSVKSREAMFFYGHPRNRFWKVLAAVLECPVPTTVEEKRRLLLDNGIALWDVIASCEITGSADSSIRNVVPNDLRPILEQADIKTSLSMERPPKNTSECIRNRLWADRLFACPPPRRPTRRGRWNG